MLIALDNGRPDRLPCQVHGWMDYYLNHYLNGMDWWEAYDHFGMDFAIYISPTYEYRPDDLAKWDLKRIDLGTNADGERLWKEIIRTPDGDLTREGATSEITEWTTEYLIKDKRDFELWRKYYPVPVGIDFTEIQAVKDRLGDRGIVRSHPYGPDQGSPWQTFCTMYGTMESIYMAMDEPDYLHHVLQSIEAKNLRAIELWKGTPADMVETDGGAGSSTVISPDMFAEFCLPYDRRQNAAYHEAGIKIVCHLCGGVMDMLDYVVQTGADGLETMTPPSMGGDCDLAEASRRVGKDLFFIGGFDQNAGFESGTPETARKLVFDCFEATKDHAGYILCPSDHFFHGDPANLHAFVQAARECEY